MCLSLKELLELKIDVDGSGNIHFLDGQTIVASIFTNVSELKVNAQLGDDDHITNFGFTFCGPVAVVYSSPETFETLEGRQPVLGVMAIMSAITFADISMWIGLNNVYIRPTTMMQFDAGNDQYELAKSLICSHTGLEWDDNYLRNEYLKSAWKFLDIK
jgi:hypothetical protein